VRSSLTGERLGSLNPWGEVIPVGDLEADGEPEFIALPLSQVGLARVLTSERMDTRFGFESAEGYRGFSWRGAFGGLGDVDGDGMREIYAVSDRAIDYARFEWVPDFGLVTIHSGRDGSVVKRISRDTLREAALAGCPVVVARIGD